MRQCGSSCDIQDDIIFSIKYFYFVELLNTYFKTILYHTIDEETSLESLKYSFNIIEDSLQ